MPENNTDLSKHQNEAFKKEDTHKFYIFSLKTKIIIYLL